MSCQVPAAGAIRSTRDLALVAKDLRDGLVTIDGAARDYGVVAGGDPPIIDEAATETLRAKLRATRRPCGRNLERQRERAYASPA